jgi:hypothetical protein
VTAELATALASWEQADALLPDPHPALRPMIGVAVHPAATPWATTADELESWTCRLAQALAEMLAGARSPGQLHGVATLEVIRQVERSYGRFGVPPGELPVRPIVRSVHLREAGPHVTEASAVVAVGRRVRAVAFRVDLTHRGWCCTAVETG